MKNTDMPRRSIPPLPNTRLLIAGLTLAAALLLAPGQTQAAVINDTFTLGADGLWNVPANWNSGVPNNGGGNTYNVFIDSNPGTDVTVTLNINATIDNLTIDAGDALSFNNATNLTVTNLVTNNGIISLNAAGNNTQLFVSGSLTLNGSGSLQMGASGNNYINGSGTLTNSAAHTIAGGGNLGNDSLRIINAGTIDANLNAVTMNVDPISTSGLTNSGTMQASNGGLLRLNGSGFGSFDNTGGVIQAVGATSEVRFVNGANIANGTLATSGGGVLRLAGFQTATLSNLTNSGTYIGDNGSTTQVAGAIVNNGSMTINGAGNTTRISLTANTTFSGSGAVQIGASSDNIFAGSGTLTNSAGHTISGGGNLGSDSLRIINAGTIDANLNAVTMNVDPASSGLTNSGTLQASNGGFLQLNGNSFGSFDNTGGVIQAVGAGSEVRPFNTASISNGTLATSGGGVIRLLSGRSVLLSNLTNSGTYIGDNGSTTQVAGAIVNNGSMTINGAGNTTRISLTANTTFSGSGAVQIGASSDNIFAGSGTLTNSAGHTISGGGNLGSDSLRIINAGTIDANLNAATMNVDPASSGLTNSGTMQATNGGFLQLNGNGLGSFDNTGGLIRAVGAGSEVRLFQGANIANGTLATSGGGVFRVTFAQTASLSNLSNTGTYIGDNFSFTQIAGAIVNSGSITLNAAGNGTNITLTADTTLSGGGAITLASLDANSNATLRGTFRLTNTNNTIQGQGGLGGNQTFFTNQSGGIIDANVTGRTLIVDPGNGTNAFLNSGTMQATNGAFLQLDGSGGGAFDNAGGVIRAVGAGSEVRIFNSGTIANGTFATSSGGVIRLTFGQTSFLSNLTNSGTYVGDNFSFTNVAGAIVNSGSMTINAAGNEARITLTADTTFSGSGALTLASLDLNTNASLRGGFRLTNVNNIIQGQGNLGSNETAFTNQATIDANISGRTLTVDPGNVANGFLNQGTMQASNGGFLQLIGSGSAGIGAFNNAGGLIRAVGAGSEVRLSNAASVTSGTLATSGGGVIRNLFGQTATLTDLTNSGTFIGDNFSTTVLSGTINNSGTMTVNAGGNQTNLQLGTDTTLTGGGTLTLASTNASSNAVLFGAFRLTNVNNTIQGEGNLGNNQSAFTNQGTIDANILGRTLTVDPGNVLNAFINEGILRASNGGILFLTGNGGGGFSSTNGSAVSAVGAGSQVQLNGNVALTSTTLSTSGGGVIRNLFGQTATLTDVTNTGTFIGDNFSTTVLSGTINNSGTMTLNAGGNQTNFQLGTDTTLTGGGTVTLASTLIGSSNARILGGFRLTNVNNTIQGEGDLGANQSAFTNQGTIDANIAGRTLTVDPGNVLNAFINEGILRASNGGILFLTGNGGGGFSSTNGSAVSAVGAGSQVQLNGNVALTSTTLSTSGGGVIRNLFGQTATLTDVTNTGTFIGDNFSTTVLSGTINNSGTMTLNAGGNQTNFQLGTDTILTGGGTVTLASLDSNSNARILGGFRLTNVNNTIQGEGNLGNNLSAFTNQGTIDANIAGRTLTIDPGDVVLNAFINEGILRASNGGTAHLTGNGNGSFTNNGTFEALNGSTLTMDASAVLTNNLAGVLTGGTYRSVSTGSGANLVIRGNAINKIAANTTVELNGANSFFQASGTQIETSLTTNNGTLKVLGNRNYTTANAFANGETPGDTALLQLGGGNFNSSSLINRAGSTIFGFGSVTPRPTNHGLIRSNGGTLTFASGIQGGSGTVQIDPGSTLDLSPGVMDSSADFLIHNGNTPGSLNLGANNFIVDADYTNANFGTGNSFNPRANVSGTGQIRASGNVAQAITGNVTSGTTATPAMAFGNVHVGDSNTLNYQVANTGTAGPALRGAIQTAANGGNITDGRLSGSGVTAANFGPIATGTTTGNLAVTFNATSAGALTGQTVHVINNLTMSRNRTLPSPARPIAMRTPPLTRPSRLTLATSMWATPHLRNS